MRQDRLNLKLWNFVCMFHKFVLPLYNYCLINYCLSNKLDGVYTKVNKNRHGGTPGSRKGASPWNRLPTKKPVAQLSRGTYHFFFSISLTGRISGSERSLGALTIFIHCQLRLMTCFQKNCRPLRSILTVLQAWDFTKSEKYFSRCFRVNLSGQQSKCSLILRTARA